MQEASTNEVPRQEVRGHEDEIMIKLAIDFENPGKLWWESGGRDLWESITEGFDNNDVAVDESIAESWIAAAAKLPGWTGGPEFAPHPVCLKEVDEDEIV